MLNRSISSHRKSALRLFSAVVSLGMLPLAAHATILTDNFDTAGSSANYNIFQSLSSTSGNTGSVGFAYNYSALGIPQAPNSIGDTGTTGMWVQSDQLAASTDAVGDISVVTKNITLPAKYQVSVEVWGNYVGDSTGIPGTGGSNSSTGATIGVQTKGTSYDSAITNAAQQGVLLDAIRDATSSGGTYRVYINGSNEGNPPPTGMYTAGNDATASQFNTADDGNYYASFMPSVTAPTVQSSAASTQTGSTVPGEFGFAWHNETVTQDGTNVTWAIDGHTIATVSDGSFTSGGSGVVLGDQDSNANTGPATYNADIFDDLVITDLTPEPASLSLLSLAGLGLIRRRRQA